MNEYEAALRVYDFMYRKFYNQPKYTLDPRDRDGYWFKVFIFRDLLPERIRTENALSPIEVIIKYLLIQFNHWTTYTPNHQMNISWMSGEKATIRWERNKHKKTDNDRIVYSGLLESWNTSISEIKEYVIHGDGQPDIDRKAMVERLQNLYESDIDDLPELFSPEEYYDSAYLVLTELGKDFDIDPNIMCRIFIQEIPRIQEGTFLDSKETSDRIVDDYRFFNRTIGHFILDVYDERDKRDKENLRLLGDKVNPEGEIKMKWYLDSLSFEDFIFESYKMLQNIYVENAQLLAD